MAGSDHRIVFVIGMHRSGTSMLGQILAHHSQASGLTGTGVNMDEGSLIQDALPLPPGLGSLALKRNARFDETSSYARPETAKALFDAWAPHWDLTKPVPDRAIRSLNGRNVRARQTGGRGATFPAQRLTARITMGRSFARFGYLLNPPYVVGPHVDGLVQLSEREAVE